MGPRLCIDSGDCMKLAVLALATFFATPALAQTAAPAGPPQAAPAAAAARWDGLPVADIVGRLTAAGLTVSPPQTNENRVYLRVEDGPMRWVMTLFSCTNGACPDVQFTAAFSGTKATLDNVAHWNARTSLREGLSRLPEDEGGEPQAVAQYDVLLSPGAGPTQLDDPIQVWRSLRHRSRTHGRDGEQPDGRVSGPNRTRAADRSAAPISSLRSQQRATASRAIALALALLVRDCRRCPCRPGSGPGPTRPTS